jgi:hypothetical protein
MANPELHRVARGVGFNGLVEHRERTQLWFGGAAITAAIVSCTLALATGTYYPAMLDSQGQLLEDVLQARPPTTRRRSN